MEEKMNNFGEEDEDKVMEWLQHHPYTLGYLSLVTTLIFIVQIAEVVLR